MTFPTNVVAAAGGEAASEEYTLTAGNSGTANGYNQPLGYGTMVPDTFKGIFIAHLYTRANPWNFGLDGLGVDSFIFSKIETTGTFSTGFQTVTLFPPSTNYNGGTDPTLWQWSPVVIEFINGNVYDVKIFE